MKKLNNPVLILFVLSFMLLGCLTVEKKIYTFEFTGKKSGKLTIKYVNLMSVEGYVEPETEAETEEYEDTALRDFEDLVETYLKGSKIEESYPYATNIQKRLFEEDGKLCGEITMEFNNLEAVRLYQFNKKSPIMFSISNTLDGEIYESSNGILGNQDFMNVVFWEPKTKVLQVTTSVTIPDDLSVSLIDHYKAWKK